MSRLRSFPCAICTHFALRKPPRKTVMELLKLQRKCSWKVAG
jgi:hypothetical protein